MKNTELSGRMKGIMVLDRMTVTTLTGRMTEQVLLHRIRDIGLLGNIKEWLFEVG